MPNLDRYLTIDDLKRVAKRRVPKMFFEYADSGAWTEQTYRENDVGLREDHAAPARRGEPREPLARVDDARPAGDDAGGDRAGRLDRECRVADGEIKAARAAEKAGITFTLSTMAICSIEDVAENTTKPFWFQLYVMKDRPFIERLIDRAKAAKCSALVLTMDLQILGQRHKDIRNGLIVPPKFTPRFMFEIATQARLGARHAAAPSGTPSAISRAT